MAMPVTVNELEHVIFKRFAHNNFLGEGLCHPSLVIISFNLLFLCCSVPFSIKEVFAVSLIPSFIVLLLKGCLGLLQYLLHCLCGRFIDFQPSGFYGNLGHASVFLRLFFLHVASIFDNFTRNSHPFF